MSARSATKGGAPEPKSATTPVPATARVERPRCSSSSRTRAAVRCSLNASSGCAWMRRRTLTIHSRSPHARRSSSSPYSSAEAEEKTRRSKRRGIAMVVWHRSPPRGRGLEVGGSFDFVKLDCSSLEETDADVHSITRGLPVKIYVAPAEHLPNLNQMSTRIQNSEIRRR